MSSLYEQDTISFQHLRDQMYAPIIYPELYPANQQYMEVNHCNSGILNNNQHQQQQQHMLDMSETSVCSSMGIRTPDIHPVPDMRTVTRVPSYGDMMHQNYELSYATWSTPLVSSSSSPSPSIISSSDNEQPYMENNNMLLSINDQISLHSGNTTTTTTTTTVSLYDNQAVLTNENGQKSATSTFGHLSREELIQRVVQLEKEKQLTCNYNNKLSDTTSVDGPSDEDDCIYTCLWNGCGLTTTSLDGLTVHIRDMHIGSGKPAYHCEWAHCSREQKPFLKRHKMQNHMRTHTGERPFECNVEGCDKRFSRPDSLNTHIKTHSSVRPYACVFENCGKAYFHARSLKKHAKSHETSMIHPYNRSSQYQKRQQHGVTIDSRQVNTPTTNTLITPLTTPLPMMIGQQQQQQQIFAAGTAYQQQQQQFYYDPHVSNHGDFTHYQGFHPSSTNEHPFTC